MSLLFVEGFEIYGADETEMTDGAFLETNNQTLSTVEVRTGTYSLRTASADAYCRRALYGEYNTLGMGFAFFLTEYPVESNTVQLCSFRNDNNTTQFSVWMSTAGNLLVYRSGHNIGESATLLASTTTSPCITDAWQHFEIQVYLDDTAGWFEIRLDGVTVLQGTGLDTIYSNSLKNCNQVLGCGSRDVINGANVNFVIYMDDWFVYSVGAGSENNDWIGDRRVLALWPSDNGATQDWTPVGASSEHNCINENPADEDTTYLEVADTTLPANCTFSLDDVPEYVGAIAGVELYVKSKKTEAGECNLQVSMQSSASETNGTNRPVSTIYAHRTDMFELDPATGALWTPTGLNAALIDLERTA